MARRTIGQQHELVATLAEREEQRQQDRQHVQPVADRHVDGHGPGGRPQHEPDRDREHVDDDDVLQRTGVERQQRHVRGRQHAEQRAQQVRAAERRGNEDERGRQRRRNRQLTRGDRAPHLHGVPAVGLAIGDVVDQIHDTGEGAEDHEGERRVQHRPSVQQPLAEAQRGEDDQVLRPLRRPERVDEADGRRSSRRRSRYGPLEEFRSCVSRHPERGGPCAAG